eukprot:SAG22_NODE_302_length_12743_cov_12.397738_4_plen_63_part_00
MRTDRRVMACFGTDFNGTVTHFFLNPTPTLAFRKLNPWETRRATKTIFGGAPARPPARPPVS